MLTALLGELGGAWLFSAGGTSTAVRDPGPWQRERTRFVPVRLSDGDTAMRSRSASIELFLWLFHYLHDTSVEPAFDLRASVNWQSYQEVNARFAASLAAEHTNAPDEVVLVHDFHLMLVPEMFTARAGRRASRLAYFHHVPWCDPAYFALLPAEVRGAVLRSLLQCDVAGFHSRRWARNFAACCQEHLPGAEVDGDAVVYRDHVTAITTAPGPVDAGAVRALAGGPLSQQWREILAEQSGGRKVVVRVDRVDLWKNLVRGFDAYELVLERTPSIADEYWFCAIVSSPRFPTARHAQYEARCRKAEARINGRFGGAGPAVTMVYPNEGENHRARALGALSLANTVLVNPTFDGLNMVAKESLVVNPDAGLLLSRNAGAFDQLEACVTAVDPFDVLSTADLLESALCGLAGPDTAEREAGLAALRAESAGAWLDRILGG